MKTRVCRLKEAGNLEIALDPIQQPDKGDVIVAVANGGICGSDIHYYHDGGIGSIRVREPIILGHEASGVVVALGSEVKSHEVGDKVALNPSQACGQCGQCQKGLQQHCLNMQFSGSAIRMPHAQGLFRQRVTLPQSQCIPLGDASLAAGACTEPLAVALHACRRAGDLVGRRVLVTGSGPVGSLCVGAARYSGAVEVVATDLHDKPLSAAMAMGATRSVNMSDQTLEEYERDKGLFDVVFECSAAASAIESAMKVIRPSGTLVQVGVSGNLSIPMNTLVGKEINWVGSHRFHGEFELAAALIREGRIDPTPIISATYPLDQAEQAIVAAGDRRQHVKVHISFNGE